MKIHLKVEYIVFSSILHIDTHNQNDEIRAQNV